MTFGRRSMRPADGGTASELHCSVDGLTVTAPGAIEMRVDVTDVLVPALDGPQRFARAPMTLPEITALRGIVGYIPPGDGHQWLTLRLADGVWIRVAPAELDLEFYMIEPADDVAKRRGVRPQFLGLWAAYRSIGRMALAAMERAANAGMSDSTCPIAGMDVVEVVAEDHTLPAIKLLAQLAAASNTDPRDSTLSLAGSLVGAIG